MSRVEAPAPLRVRRVLTASGLVQGVGFRPFVYRLATELGVAGSVRNTPGGVEVEVEGAPSAIDELTRRLRSESPPNAVIRRVDSRDLVSVGLDGFAIEPSEANGAMGGQVPSDVAPCPECVAEISDPGHRMFRYPFAACARCGPRFTIIEAMPYDRSRTTMVGFALCPHCRSDYRDSTSRRFHAQAIACPTCGPQLALWNPEGSVLTTADRALREAVDAIRRGLVVAVKGVGGFHLMVDAGNEAAVRELRLRKQRPDKPFALLCGSLQAVRAICHVDALEADLLRSPQAPIVLLKARGSDLAHSVAPGNPYFGVMLPPSPLHGLLMHDLEAPVVATSGNRSEEPICTDEHEAIDRFRGIADVLLVHDRPIARQADDAVVRVIAGESVLLRLGRGYAPLAIPGTRARTATLAVGGGHKNAVAVATGDGIVLSQHVGGLRSPEARAVFQRTAGDLARLYGVRPAVSVCDLHPDDAATLEARASGGAVIAVQHHAAHIASCLAEHELDGPVLGVAWDGTGYGPDGTVWGGEFLIADRTTWRRVGHLRRFRLPGGERAVREPRRAAWGVLFELLGPAAFKRIDLQPVSSLNKIDQSVMSTMLMKNINCPITSSAGRLFDAVSALVGIRQGSTFEGQAAMELEFAAEQAPSGEPYPFALHEQDGVLVVDWGPTLQALLSDLATGATVSRMARAFHDTLADAIVGVAQRAGQGRIVLTGGCFQNRCLAERASHQLATVGFEVYRHRMVPPNDGGLAVGQAAAACGRGPER